MSLLPPHGSDRDGSGQLPARRPTRFSQGSRSVLIRPAPLRKRGLVASPGTGRYSVRVVPEQFLFAWVIFWAAAEEESNAP
jgi:hypothetical protein